MSFNARTFNRNTVIIKLLRTFRAAMFFISDKNIENIFENLFTPKNQCMASTVKFVIKLKTAQYYLVGKSYA